MDGMAQSQRRPCQPRPIEGDIGGVEACRTAALGGHVARCQDCAYTAIAYNSCRKTGIVPAGEAN